MQYSMCLDQMRPVDHLAIKANRTNSRILFEQFDDTPGVLDLFR